MRVFMKTCAALTAFLILAFNYSDAMRALREAPEAFYAEDPQRLSIKLTSSMSLSDLASVSAVSSEDEVLSEQRVEYRLFGLFTLKSVPAYIGKRAVLTPGGQAVGISIYTLGVLVVGTGSFIDEYGRSVSPAVEAGLKAGDIIVSAGGRTVSTAKELREALDAGSSSTELLVERNGKRIFITLMPAVSETGEKRIGAWVRDSTIGIGTLTFIDTETGMLAALGHAVLDADTGSTLRIRDGKLVLARILGVTKGRQGVPGELMGTFSDESAQLGSIVSNTELGIFGYLSAYDASLFSESAVETAYPDEVHTGDAYIITSADGTPKRYSCRIIRTGTQKEPAPKGLVIEITDERLNELTGGIVQGMSGSPIIQDGRLVGVVTHVFVNDPRKGYGAYAYWMLNRFGGEYGGKE